MVEVVLVESVAMVMVRAKVRVAAAAVMEVMDIEMAASTVVSKAAATEARWGVPEEARLAVQT